MPWYNTGGNTAQDYGFPEEQEFTALGVVGYATQAEAEKHPLTPTQLGILAGLGLASQLPGNPVSGIAPNPLNVQGPNIPNPLTGLAAIGDFFQRLTQPATWVRVGEVLLGVILLAVGVARLTHAVPIATKIAGVAAKGAVLA